MISAAYNAGALALNVSAALVALDVTSWARNGYLSWTSIKQLWERIDQISLFSAEHAVGKDMWTSILLPVMELPGFLHVLVLAALLLGFARLRAPKMTTTFIPVTAESRRRTYSIGDINALLATSSYSVDPTKDASAKAKNFEATPAAETPEPAAELAVPRGGVRVMN